MRHARANAVCAVLLLLLLPAAAQPAAPPVENVTVTGTKSREAISAFVQSLATPTRMTGKIARWAQGVCPVAVGLKPVFTKFITDRLKAVAASAGAPVNGSADCKPNIEIVFTTTPQALLDNIRKTQPELLGYFDKNSQRDALATVTRPIQAWYTSATQDVRGHVEVDNAKGGGLEITIPDADQPGRFETIVMPHGHAGTVTGSRLGDGMRSVFYHVIIVANPDKLVEYEIGSLADYIALLALAQPDSLDACQTLPSIVNLLAKGCERVSNDLTANDLAYLRGLYKMSPDLNLGTQKDEVTYQMQQMLEGK